MWSWEGILGQKITWLQRSYQHLFCFTTLINIWLQHSEWPTFVKSWICGGSSSITPQEVRSDLQRGAQGTCTPFQDFTPIKCVYKGDRVQIKAASFTWISWRLNNERICGFGGDKELKLCPLSCFLPTGSGVNNHCSYFSALCRQRADSSVSQCFLSSVKRGSASWHIFVDLETTVFRLNGCQGWTFALYCEFGRVRNMELIQTPSSPILWLHRLKGPSHLTVGLSLNDNPVITCFDFFKPKLVVKCFMGSLFILS